MHELVAISKPDDLAKLKNVLPDEFAPEVVAETLRGKLNPQCKNILVEYPYVDKDYRSTFYHFYAKKGLKYNSFCARLHFFNDKVSLSDDLMLRAANEEADPRYTPLLPSEVPSPLEIALQRDYYGYMVLRPTTIYTIGRSLLSPTLIDGFQGSLMECTEKVHLLGNRIRTRGFPYMSQHTDISRCAHVACWAILRHYSERHPRYTEYLTYDITRMAHAFDPGGIVPSLGLHVENAERIFSAAGMYPLVVGRDSTKKPEFYRQLFAYLESGFPLFAAMHTKRHAIALVGRSAFTNTSAATGNLLCAWDFVEAAVAIDDNVLPYSTINRNAKNYHKLDDIDAFVVPLPEKLFYSAEAVDQYARTLATEPLLTFDHTQSGQLVIRYFVTTSAALKRFYTSFKSQFASDLLAEMMELTLPQFVWVIEISTLQQWENSQIQTRAIIDATASEYEENVVYVLHDNQHAVFVERGLGQEPFAREFQPPGNAPLSRMPGNLEHH